MSGSEVVETGGAGDVDLRRAELGVVEEEGGLGGTRCFQCQVSAFHILHVWELFIGGANVSFSKVTVADFGLSVASEVGVTEREVIFPLLVIVQSASPHVC